MRKKREKLEMMGRQGNEMEQNGEHEHDRIQPTPAHMKHARQILRNVNVYVSKKLCRAQGELSKIVEYLGGEYSWTYNQATCTHFIYQGFLSDNNKELNAAREANKTIVTPEWLYACQQERAHVNESLFVPPQKSESVHTDEDNSNQKENETTGLEDNNQESVQAQKDEEHADLKRAMLDQLQDQLVKIGKNSKNSSLNQKKLARNRSDVSKSDVNDETSNNACDIPDSEETAMLQQLEFNGDEITRKRKINSKIPSSISSENVVGAKNGRFMIDDDLGAGGACHMAPSQIQVTMWKDQPDSMDVKVTQAAANKAKSGGAAANSRNQRVASNSSKSDAIAERIVHATRMASSTTTTKKN